MDRRDENNLPPDKKKTERLKKEHRDNRIRKPLTTHSKYTEKYCMENHPAEFVLFDFWQSLSNVQKTRWKSKSTETAFLQIKKALRNNSIEQIQGAMQTYNDLLTEPFTVFTNTKTIMILKSAVRVGADQFFAWGMFAKNALANNSIPEAKVLLEHKNLFSICLKGREEALALLSSSASKPVTKLTSVEKLIIQTWEGGTGEEVPKDKLYLLPKMASLIPKMFRENFQGHNTDTGRMLVFEATPETFFEYYVGRYIEEQYVEDKLQFYYLASETFYYNMEKFMLKKGWLFKF